MKTPGQAAFDAYCSVVEAWESPRPSAWSQIDPHLQAAWEAAAEAAVLPQTKELKLEGKLPGAEKLEKLGQTAFERFIRHYGQWSEDQWVDGSDQFRDAWFFAAKAVIDAHVERKAPAGKSLGAEKLDLTNDLALNIARVLIEGLAPAALHVVEGMLAGKKARTVAEVLPHEAGSLSVAAIAELEK